MSRETHRGAPAEARPYQTRVHIARRLGDVGAFDRRLRGDRLAAEPAARLSLGASGSSAGLLDAAMRLGFSPLRWDFDQTGFALFLAGLDRDRERAFDGGGLV